MGSLGWVALVGGLLIAAVLVWAVISNRRRSNADRRRTQDATHNLYKEMDREDQRSDPDRKQY